MRKFIAAAVMAASLWGPSLHAATSATLLITHDLQGPPHREGTIDYAPGAAEPLHRHEASVSVSIMQVEGGARVPLQEGQTFFAGPDDVHLIGRNASQTEPARFLAFSV